MLKFFKYIILIFLTNCFYLLFYYLGDFILLQVTQVNISEKYKFLYPFKNQAIIGLYINVFCLLLFFVLKFVINTILKKKFNIKLGFIFSYLLLVIFIGFSSFSYGLGSIQNFEMKNWFVLILTSLFSAFVYKKLILVNQ